jgi:DNA-binding transcriptional MocR family regulator
MSRVRRQAFAAVADAGRVTVVENLALADLFLDDELAPLPLAALSAEVIAVGSVSKLLWGGLRIGWIRVGAGVGAERLGDALVARKAALNLATSAVTQAVAAQLLDAVDAGWLSAHRSALVRRRDHLCAMIGSLLPAWRVSVPSAGLSLWVWLPVEDAAAFAHVASRHGVVVAVGGAACVDGRHRGYIRLSFAEQLDTLSLAVERLAVAWQAHTENLAAGLVGVLAWVPPGRRTVGPASVVELVVVLDELLDLGVTLFVELVRRVVDHSEDVYGRQRDVHGQVRVRAEF